MSWQHKLHQRVENMWWSSNRPPAWLRGLSHMYQVISRKQLEKRADQAVEPVLPMISVGNITVGGSGKTPFVIWLSKLLQEHGYQPVVLCRGDGGSSQVPQVLDHDTQASHAGDEAVLLQQQCGCPVISGTDRVVGSEMAARLGNIIILDDGFQYRHLKRVCDIVLIPDEGMGNGCLIPAGPLREPVSSLERADLIVRTGCEDSIPLTSKKEWQWSTTESEMIDIKKASNDRPTQVFAATGIARPQRFLQSLKKLDIKIKDHHFFPDHHQFSDQNVQALLSIGLPVVVTAKDAVKLKAIWPKDQPLWVLEQQAQAENGLADAIIFYLESHDSP
ncbi:MAG: tetraacyldisaccharide 4'-kinase [Mariprofundaceae bacterium]